jgi:hypothetical protein
MRYVAHYNITKICQQNSRCTSTYPIAIHSLQSVEQSGTSLVSSFSTPHFFKPIMTHLSVSVQTYQLYQTVSVQTTDQLHLNCAHRSGRLDSTDAS